MRCIILGPPYRHPFQMRVVLILVAVLGVVLFGVGEAAAQSHLWSRVCGSAQNWDYGREIAVDGSGNVYVAGEMYDTVDFGGGGLTSAGDADAFLVKYDANGNHVWSQVFGDADFQRSAALAVDGVGNVYLGTLLGGSADFGGGVVTGEFAVAKFDPSGAHQWTLVPTAPGSRLNGICVTSAGDVCITGGLWASADFGGGTLTSAGILDFFMARYDTDGNHVWSERFGGTSTDEGTDVSFDLAGNVCALGEFHGTVSFGGANLSAAGNSDIFLAKYDATGSHLWSKRFGNSWWDGASDVVTDASNNVYITGSNTGSGFLDFGGGSLPAGGYLARFDPAGTHVWSQTFASFGASVDVDDSGVLFGSEFQDSVDLGGGMLYSAGQTDAALARFGLDGTHEWSLTFGGIDDDGTYRVAADGMGGAVITGYFSETVDFGGGPEVSNGWWDIYVARYGELPVSVAITSFEARAVDSAVRLRGSFSSNLGVTGVNVYRAEGESARRLHESLSHSDGEFHYEDRNVEPGRSYRYQIGVVDGDGEFLSPVETVRTQSVTTDLMANTPNPFNPTTTIHFTLEDTGPVSLSVFDVQGRLVATLIDGPRRAGRHAIQWNGTGDDGRAVSSGVYFCRLQAGSTVRTRRMVLLK